MHYNVFEFRDRLIKEYSAFSRSFTRIGAADIRKVVDDEYAKDRYWPEPLIQINPNYQRKGTIADLVAQGLLHRACADIFRTGKPEGKPQPLELFAHQLEAIATARNGKSYVVTTGTGSGKSLAFFIPIVDRILRDRELGSRPRTRAIVIYPMNALANSQLEELEKFLHDCPGDRKPFSVARYTGQEKNEERRRIADDPPDILLTNFMMLELILTRYEEIDRRVVEHCMGLEFLVLDELHTYCGRQGADVAMLVRRLRERLDAPRMLCKSHVQAVWLAHVEKPLETSIAPLLELEADGKPLKAGLRASFEAPETLARAREQARRVIDSVRSELTAAPRFDAHYVDRVVQRAPDAFDVALDRWRKLFEATRRQMEMADQVVRSHAVGNRERDNARRRYGDAARQYAILLKAGNTRNADFYTYRYLASQGFLPGYNFPRLPLLAWIPGRGSRAGGEDDEGGMSAARAFWPWPSSVRAASFITKDAPFASFAPSSTSPRRSRSRRPARWRSKRPGSVRTDSPDEGDSATFADEALLDKVPNQPIVPFVEDHRNILVLTPAEKMSDTTMTTLQAALRRGIEQTFQIEASELVAEPLPNDDKRRTLLFYEAAEGGAGVLARLAAEPGSLAEVAGRALPVSAVLFQSARPRPDQSPRRGYPAIAYRAGQCRRLSKGRDRGPP